MQDACFVHILSRGKEQQNSNCAANWTCLFALLLGMWVSLILYTLISIPWNKISLQLGKVKGNL